MRRTGQVGAAVLVLLACGAATRWWSDTVHAREVANTTQANAVRTVLTTPPQTSKGERKVSLPATLRGRNEAAIYARTNGYVRAWRKDIGDNVRRGEVLVVIDTPEVDQDLAQARAMQAQVKARLALAVSSMARYEALRAGNAVSQQEYEERRAAQQQAEADLAASQANVRRLQQLHDFGRVTAPFDGVVVKRLVDVGALVTAGSANARPLYELSQPQDLRLTVAVPQAYAQDVKVGKAVQVKLLERPVQPIQGEVVRVAGGLDASTRAMDVEVRITDPTGTLLPGAYVEVALGLGGSSKAMLVPPNALQFRQDGPRVAVVNAQQRIELKPVKLGRDLGKQVEVLAGLGPKDQVVLNPPDAIEAGEPVRAQPAPPPKEDKPAGAGKAPAPRPTSAS